MMPPTGNQAPKTQKARARTYDYGFECNWLIELADNKLPNKNCPIKT